MAKGDRGPRVGNLLQRNRDYGSHLHRAASGLPSRPPNDVRCNDVRIPHRLDLPRWLASAASAAGTVQRSSFTDLLNWELEPGNQRRVAPSDSLRASSESDERVSHSATGSLAPSAAPRLDITQESWEVSRVFLGFTGSSYSVNRWRTFAMIWDAVILSAVSTPTMRPPAGSCSMRFLSSPFASPGPKIRTASASLTCAATRS